MELRKRKWFLVFSVHIIKLRGTGVWLRLQPQGEGGFSAAAWRPVPLQASWPPPDSLAFWSSGQGTAVKHRPGGPCLGAVGVCGQRLRVSLVVDNICSGSCSLLPLVYQTPDHVSLDPVTLTACIRAGPRGTTDELPCQAGSGSPSRDCAQSPHSTLILSDPRGNPI